MASKIDAAELAFFGSLGQIPETVKVADLSPETRAVLDVGDPPEALDQLEAQAASGDVGVDDGVDTPDGVPHAPVEAGPVQVEDGPGPVDDEALPDPSAPPRATAGKAFTGRATHPLKLFDILNARYGSSWLDWEHETLVWAIRRDFGSVGAVTADKIGALVVAAETAGPWNDWDTFEKCGVAWANQTPVFGAYQPLTPSQAAFTVQVLEGIHAGTEFGHEIQAYLGAVLDENGWVYAPEEWFPGAQALLDRREDTAEFRDEVVAAWAKVKDIDPGQIEFEEDPINIQMVKLFSVKVYLEERAAERTAPAATGVPSSVGVPVVP